MKNFAICSLAYGDEHINEFNLLCKSLLSIDNSLVIYVCTDDKTKIENQSINIVETVESFNYNLKRVSIETAFEKYDTILFLDTDMFVNKSVDFSAIDKIDRDGFHTSSTPYTVFTHQDERISVLRLLRDTDYGRIIRKLNNDSEDLTFLDEQLFIIKITDKEKRKQFIDNWENIFQKTKHYHIKDKVYQNSGIYEGLIISLACRLANVDIIHKYEILNIFYNAFSHFGWYTDKPQTKLI